MTAGRHKKLCAKGHRRQPDARGVWFCPTCKQEARLRRLCIVDGCTSNRQANGYCHFHLNRFKKFGDPLAGPPRRGSGTCQNGHLLEDPPNGGKRKCYICAERRLEQRRVCACGAPRLKGSKKCEACKVQTYLRAQLRATCGRFGVTVEEYERLLEQQGGRCAICRAQPRTKRLAVDHDHKTGEIRGLLCQRCNQSMLGAARERADILLRAVSYLERPPARTGAGPDDLGHYMEAELEALTEDARAKSDRWAVVLCDEDKPIGEWPLIMSHELFMAVKPADCVVIEKDIEDL